MPSTSTCARTTCTEPTYPQSSLCRAHRNERHRELRTQTRPGMQVPGTSLHALDLTVRTHNAVWNAGWRNVETLFDALLTGQVSRTPGFSPRTKALPEIVAALSAYYANQEPQA